MNDTVYCVDTSSLLEAWVRKYPRDIFPGVWNDMETLIQQNRLISPEEVKRELAKKDDDLFAWAMSNEKMFVPFDHFQEHFVIEIMVNHRLLMETGRKKHAADPFVIALAKLEGCVVITEELGGSESKPKIPQVCTAMGLSTSLFLI